MGIKTFRHKDKTSEVVNIDLKKLIWKIKLLLNRDRNGGYTL